jgi:hypothetical protein
MLMSGHIDAVVIANQVCLIISTDKLFLRLNVTASALLRESLTDAFFSSLIHQVLCKSIDINHFTTTSRFSGKVTAANLRPC